MPNPRYYQPPPTPPPPSHRDQMLAQFNQPEQGGMDPGALMQMLGHLYGIQQGQQKMELDQQELGVKQKDLASRDAYYQAQSGALQHHLPEGLQYLPPEMQQFAFGQAYPEYAQKVAADAQGKNQRQWALTESEAHHAPNTPDNLARNTALWGPENAQYLAGLGAPAPSSGASDLRPGQQVGQFVTALPQHVQDYNNAWYSGIGSFLDDLVGSPLRKMVDAQQTQAKQQTQQDVKNWTAKQAGTYTPPANTFGN